MSKELEVVVGDEMILSGGDDQELVEIVSKVCAFMAKREVDFFSVALVEE